MNVAIIIFLIGLYGLIANKNLVKIVMALCVMGNGVLLFFISVGYVEDATAPIITNTQKVVDPLPQAFMLTMIVINLCLIALALALVMRLYEEYKTLDVDDLHD
jgi:multicomponent Na+:H+ antiporter subunit C